MDISATQPIICMEGIHHNNTQPRYISAGTISLQMDRHVYSVRHQRAHCYRGYVLWGTVAR